MRSFFVSLVLVLAVILGVHASSISNGGGVSSGGGGASISAIRAHFANNITTPDHAFHRIAWDTIDNTVGSALSLNTSTGVVTVTSAGLVTVSAFLVIDTTNSSQAAVFIGGDGTQPAPGLQSCVNGTGNAFGGATAFYAGGATSFYASPGDQFSLSYGQQGSGTTTIHGGSGNNGVFIQFVANGVGGSGGGSFTGGTLTSGITWTGTYTSGSPQLDGGTSSDFFISAGPGKQIQTSGPLLSIPNNDLGTAADPWGWLYLKNGLELQLSGGSATSIELAGITWSGDGGSQGALEVIDSNVHQSTFSFPTNSGASSATLGGSTCPAVTPGTVNKWLVVTDNAGDVLYVPAWR